MVTAAAYAATSADGPLEKTTVERRELGPLDILIDIKFAGICHSDIHTARNEWGGAKYPIVPGHEIAGVVAAVGSDVTKHKVGDRVGVGCFVDSCGECDACTAGEEQYCRKGVTGTYNATGRDGERTQGGYSTHIVVTEHFVLSIPEASNSTLQRRSCARASPCTHRCGTGMPAPARRSPSSGSAASVTSV